MSRPDVVIPHLRGTSLHENTLKLPAGVRYHVVDHDQGEEETAVQAGLAAAEGDYTLLLPSDGWLDHEAFEFLTGDLNLDADVLYGRTVRFDEAGEPVEQVEPGPFCPHRLRVENYLPETCLIRRAAYRPGVGPWQRWLRMSEADAGFKYVPEAVTARTTVTPDPSPKPAEQDYLASFYHQATPGTTYWRCLLPARYLPGITVFNHPVLENDEFPRHRGAAVMQFGGDAAHYLEAKFMQEAHGIRVLVEVDDNYLAWNPRMKRTGWVDKLRPDGGFSVEGHRKLVAAADGVIVTTDHLAKQYRKVNENVFVCPNQIDPPDWPELVKPDDGVFRVGWFASGSHQGDGSLIRRALDWASRQKDVEVVLGGVGATSGKPWFKFPFKHVAWTNDFGAYRRMLAQLDVGLAPVVGSPWATCRSDLKALEYAMVGAAPVLSVQPPYVDWADGERCLKAKDEKGFLDAVKWMVTHRGEARQMGADARKHVLEHRTVEANISKWTEAVCPS